MRYLASFLLLFAFCFAAAAAAPKVAEPDVEFLLTSAAKDFRLNHQPGSLRFREVRAGRIPLSEGEIQPMLCGQFQADAEWIPFATIKTSDYEQWNGAQGQSFCENVSVVWVEDRDLTSTLQNRFDALK